MTNSNELRNTVATLSPGKKTPVVVFRNGKEITLSVVLVERDEGKGKQPFVGERPVAGRREFGGRDEKMGPAGQRLD